MASPPPKPPWPADRRQFPSPYGKTGPFIPPKPPEVEPRGVVDPLPPVTPTGPPELTPQTAPVLRRPNRYAARDARLAANPPVDPRRAAIEAKKARDQAAGDAIRAQRRATMLAKTTFGPQPPRGPLVAPPPLAAPPATMQQRRATLQMLDQDQRQRGR